MLVRLSVRDLSLVERLDVALGPGLNVLTGETGAGKSVLVGALSLLLGARSSPDVVRSGAHEALIEAELDVDASPALLERLQAAGLSVARRLVVSRSIRTRGRGRVVVAGRPMPAARLAELLHGVIDFTGQHEHVGLLAPESHLEVLDAFAGVNDARGRVEEAHREVARLRSALAEAHADEEEKRRRLDYLRFAIDEIDEARPEPNELERLRLSRARLRSVEELAAAVGQAEAALYSGEGAVIEVLGKVSRALERAAAIDARLLPYAHAATGLGSEVSELARCLVRYGEGLEAEPESLAALEARIDQLERIVRKHGRSLEEVLAARAAMERELERLEGAEARRGSLEAALGPAVRQLHEHAAELSAKRRAAAPALEAAISAALAELSMASSTRVAVALEERSEVGPRGSEQAELMIAPNRGEGLRPLRRIASGGELSRLLLAIKQVLAGKSAVSTYVFDEVDTGVGGGVAEVLGRKLHDVAGSAQVIVVTHLPQVAAFADAHFRVVKGSRDGRTCTTVEQLDGPGVIEELARMLGGVRITTRTRALAEELRIRARSPRARPFAHPPAKVRVDVERPDVSLKWGSASA